jgi:hypothetical protein
MQNREASAADQAGEWLRKNVTDPDTQIDITWTVGEPDDRVFDEVLTILFGPETGSPAA